MMNNVKCPHCEKRQVLAGMQGYKQAEGGIIEMVSYLCDACGKRFDIDGEKIPSQGGKKDE